MLNKESCPEILNKFLIYLSGFRGYSIHTIKAYQSDLMQFFNFIKIYKEIQFSVYDFNIFILLQVKEEDIIAFIVHLNFNEENEAYTRQRKVVSIKAFYRWLLSINPINNQRNPTENLPHIKVYERLPKYLNLNQAKKIQEIFTKENSNFPERNNLIISLFLSTGLRVSELVNINLNNIDFENRSITIFGKNNKERKVYFNSYCKKRILNYSKTIEHIDNINALFINKWGNRISIRSVQRICEKAFELINLNDLGYSTHTLRHTAATILYRYSNDDILLVKEFLGHSSLASSQIYTHLDNQRLKEAVNNHPLSNYKVA